VRTVVEANPDAVQLSPGQAHLLQSIPGKAKPALVLVRNPGCELTNSHAHLNLPNSAWTQRTHTNSRNRASCLAN
jgi:DhnA family fructose-bisphosphate aldolase class Ia